MESTDENGVHDAADTPRPRQLPDDLPRSLDDRRTVPQIAGETEIYDAWQGACPADPASELPAMRFTRSCGCVVSSEQCCV